MDVVGTGAGDLVRKKSRPRLRGRRQGQPSPLFNAGAMNAILAVYLFGWSRLIPVRARSRSIEGRQQRLATDLRDQLI
jgi:hypothetical protein